MAITLSERDRMLVRTYLGYPTTTAQFVLQHGLGRNAGIASNWLVDAAFQNITPEGVEEVQKILRTLDRIDEILGGDALDRLAASKLGDLVLRTGRAGESEPDLLWKERTRWILRIADLLNVSPHPTSMAVQSSGGNGVITRHHS